MRILLLLTLFFGLYSGYAQNNVEEKIIGTWIWVAESDSFVEDTGNLLLNDTESEPETLPQITLKFQSDNSLLINEVGLESSLNFKIKDFILTMGNRKYIVVKLDDARLILKDKDGLFDSKYEYKKLTN